jgi:hypothetical protein
MRTIMQALTDSGSVIDTVVNVAVLSVLITGETPTSSGVNRPAEQERPRLRAGPFDIVHPPGLEPGTH